MQSGYHQVRMDKANIEMMAFCTQHHNFEFLVMPFGAMFPATRLQAMMNDMLHDFTCQFIPVCFDDLDLQSLLELPYSACSLHPLASPRP
jgi:hypothetical protein